MKNLKYLIVLFLFAASACNSDEPVLDAPGSISEMAEIECVINNQYTPTSRTYYEADVENNVYIAKWYQGDEVAMCFDGSETPRRFQLLKGANSSKATFYGPVPNEYSKISAVYPFDIYEGQAANAVEVCLPSEIYSDTKKTLYGVMPMFAQGNLAALNFYNLMSVLKISVSGSGLLRSVSVSSVDGYGLSGKGTINTDENNIPKLTLEQNGNGIKINIGSVLLSSDATDIYLPIPSVTYENGLKLEFEFEGDTEVRDLKGPLYFERSVMRAVKPYQMNVSFDFDNYEIKDNEIWYMAQSHLSLSAQSGLLSSVVSDSYSKDKKIGVVSTQSPILKIAGQLFNSPKLLTFIKLPNSVQEIAMNGFSETSIERFDAPKDLKILGTDAFLGCSKLKRVILNDGFESMGLEAFGVCPNLVEVYLPATLQIIGAYSFRESTSKLDHWDGDCPLIDEDRHSLYSNSAYGFVSEELYMIDIVAGCNLTEYSIPKQASNMQNYSMSGLKKLKKLTIHEDFKSFGVEAFSELRKLEIISSYAETPPLIDYNQNRQSSALKRIRVPRQSVNAYKQADGWKEFSDLIISL